MKKRMAVITSAKSRPAPSEPIPAAIPSWLAEVMGTDYLEPRQLPDGTWCALQRFLFTTGLMVDIKPGWYGRRYCFESYQDASIALREWDGKVHPSGNWIKCKGAGVDLLNPAFCSDTF